MPIALIAVWTFLKNNPWIYWVIGILAILGIITGLVFHEIHSIEDKQKIKDQLKQEQIVNQALMDEEKKDKLIIETFQDDVGQSVIKTNQEKESINQIIQNNPMWSNTNVPSGVNEELNQ